MGIVFHTTATPSDTLILDTGGLIVKYVMFYTQTNFIWNWKQVLLVFDSYSGGIVHLDLLQLLSLFCKKQCMASLIALLQLILLAFDHLPSITVSSSQH